MALLVPTVHLNGTAKSDLIEQLEQAYDALATAQIKLSEAEPNGRDFYPQGTYAIIEAVGQHVERLQKIRSVQAEINAILEGVLQQGGSNEHSPISR
jgi:hypothetical protein